MHLYTIDLNNDPRNVGEHYCLGIIICSYGAAEWLE